MAKLDEFMVMKVKIDIIGIKHQQQRYIDSLYKISEAVTPFLTI